MAWNFYNASGELQINDGGVQAASAVFTGNVDLGSNLLVGNAGSTGIAISANGEVTMAAHPCVMATNSADDSNVTGSSSAPYVDFDNEVFDQGGDFASDIFTAPVTGRYLMTMTLGISGITSAVSQISVQAVVSNNNSYLWYENDWSGVGYMFRSAAYIVDMDASDTAKIQVDNNGEASDVHDIAGSSDGRTSVGYYLLA